MKLLETQLFESFGLFLISPSGALKPVMGIVEAKNAWFHIRFSKRVAIKLQEQVKIGGVGSCTFF